MLLSGGENWGCMPHIYTFQVYHVFSCFTEGCHDCSNTAFHHMRVTRATRMALNFNWPLPTYFADFQH